MQQIFFLFIGEGVSDNPLVQPLEKLCVLCGADEAAGTAVDWQLLSSKPPRSVARRVRAALEIEPAANLVFVHRDADAPEPVPRLEEIRRAIEELALEVPGVPVVPIQETEAWLLLDEAEIRKVAENPRGRMDLALPPLSQVESVANPKARLEEALYRASGLRGRRLKNFKRSLPFRHRLLLERLDPEGPISELSAWRRLCVDLERALQSSASR